MVNSGRERLSMASFLCPPRNYDVQVTQTCSYFVDPHGFKNLFRHEQSSAKQ
jgi:hypothetical protein